MKQPIWTFRIGDVLPSSDPLARFVTVVGAAFNDLVFINGLLVRPDVVTSEGEQQYLLRTATAHLWEFSLTLKQWKAHASVLPLIDGLDRDLRDDLEAVLCIADPGEDPVLKTIAHLRNAATWHYASPNKPKWIEKALAESADHEGSIQFGATMGGIRVGFADEIILQFAVQLFPGGDDEADLAAFRLLLQQVAELMTAAIRVSHGILVAFFKDRSDAV